MATPAERKALLFFAIVATFGAGVRLWRARHPHQTHHSVATSTGNGTGRVRSSGRYGTRSRTRPARKNTRRSRTSRSRIGHIDRDSTSIIDLDRATVAEIDALGVLPPGTGRLIVDDRDTYGPFGSIEELRRVPFLSSAIIRRLAPRVTFSLLPRPKNTVIQPRSRADVVRPRTKHLGKRSADP